MKATVRIMSLLGLLLLVLTSSTVQAGEPTEQFLEQLLANGYYDEAMTYLTQMETSNLSSQEFKESILYRQGTVLIQASRMDRDRQIRQRRLSQAQEKLEQFIQQHAQHPDVEAATEELAKIAVENARVLVQNAKNQAGNQQKESFQLARTQFDEAISVYESRLAQIKAELEAIPKPLDPNTQADLIERRDTLQDNYLRAMLTVPMLLFEKAETYDKGDEARTADFQAASTKFDDMAGVYRRFAAGITARLWCGRAKYEMGDFPAALTDFGDILVLPNDDPFLRGLRSHALHYSMKIWLDESQNAYQEAIDKGTEQIDTIRSDQEEADLHWLGIRYYLALACVMQAKADENLSGTEKGALLAKAKKHAEVVASLPSPYTEMAQRLLSELTGEVLEEDDEPEDIEPTTFAEAKEYGDTATREMQEAQRNINIFKQGPADPADTEAAAAMAEQLGEAEQQVISRRARALYCYQQATALANLETPLVELNQVRFLLAYHLYSVERYYEASVLADFYAKNCVTESKGNALKASNIALVCYQHLYRRARAAATAAAAEDEQADDTPTPEEAFAVGKVLAMADYIATNFSEEPEAQEALITLIRFLVQQGDLAQATEYLEMINPEGSKRGEAELILGRALWSRYKMGVQALRNKAAGEPVDESDLLSDAQLEQSKQLAEQTLQAGIERMKGTGRAIDTTFVDALLALTEIYIDTGQAPQAIPLLEDPTFGLIILVGNNDPATQRQNFASAVYRAALRSYIAAVPEQATSAESDAMMDKAKQVMAGLKTVIPDPRRLISLYFSLAGDIKSQLDLVQDPEKKASLARAFETFLNQIAEGSNDKTELLWVADSLLNVGQSFDPGPSQDLPATASELYAKSVQQFNRILKMKNDGQLELSDEEELQLRVRLAGALRSTRQYRLAMNEFDQILSQNNGLLAIQLEAAQCYEDWVDSGVGIPNLYIVATRGGRWNADLGKQGAYAIWGWSGIANKTMGDDKFLDTYYQASYHWASCYLKYAQSTEKDNAQEFLGNAARTIKEIDFQFLSPSLTMPTEEMTPQQMQARDYAQQWRPRFNELMMQVQEAQGEEPTGLGTPQQ